MGPTRASFVVGSVVGLAAIGAAVADPAEPHRRGTPRPPAEKVDPKADALLRKMSTDLASMKRFSFAADHVTEVVTQDGQKLQVLASSTVAVERPGRLRSDRKGRYGDVTLYYDGKDLTVYGKRENLYATAHAPDTIDQMIDFAREDLGLEAPAADLLYTNAYGALMEDVVSGAYIDQAQIDGRTCHHLAYRGNETDWQIWIEDGPRALPCRFVITSKNVKGAPEHTVVVRDWKVEPVGSATQFTFVPPRDAGRIQFWSVAKRQQEPTKRGGA